jgi:crotonobetainyl-CoA:carnitine CoA-transferase CaiB-like acyl-CoA transferase
MGTGQLDGLRVLDLSRVLAGPLAGQMLGDLGAEIIKVERPGIGDEARYFGPPFAADDVPNSELESPLFLCANRNKRGIAVDFSRPEGQLIIRALIGQSDVLIENYKVGVLSQYGLDYESARQVNPKIIYCSITGYGQTGPDRHRAGYDAIFQGQGGLMHSIGYPDGHPAAGPMRVGLSIVDVITSLFADVAILAALHGRGEEGEHVDISLLDACIAAMSHHAVQYLVSGELPKRRGNLGAGGGVPSGTFSSLDGQIVLTVGNDEQFARFCLAVDRERWTTDRRFATNRERSLNRDALHDLIGDLISEKPSAFWIGLLQNAGIAVGQVNDLRQVFLDRQVISRGMRVEAPHRRRGHLSLVANPIHFSGRPVGAYVAPPMRGEHTRSVLGGLLGMPEEEIDRLSREGVVEVAG